MNPELPTENIPQPAVASELEQMVAIDQEMREQSEVADEIWDNNIDVQNTTRMKEIVGAIGWPTISMVGREGAENAWLLVQHADLDVDFQAQCLHLMKEAPENEVNKINIAYLEDRVRVNQGKGQLYGTQFTQKNNQHLPREIEDMEHIDARREVMGMGPLQEQIDLMYQKYPLTDSSE
jgi:hypothetical protein